MISSAPGKVILFGEHAVVYDRLGIAGAIGERVTVNVSEGNNGVEIIRKLEPKRTVISREKLFDKLKMFRQLYAEKNFDSIKGMSFIDALTVVIGETMDRHGYRDVKVEISFDNVLKNVGRSASKSAAIVVALAKFLGKDVSKEEVAEIAYLGDVVAHGGTPSGIDTNTVIHGGFVSYKKSEGFKPLDIGQKLPLIIVDSGEPSKTGVTVPAVRQLRQHNTAQVDAILDEIDSIAREGQELLKQNNLKRLGELMNRNHTLLKQLGVSTKKLDSLVAMALSNGALGAKLTGGGGGGGIIVLAKDDAHALQLKKMFEAHCISAFSTSVGVEGVKLE